METFSERMRRHDRVFRERFEAITGREPTKEERWHGLDLYYSDRYGALEAAEVIAGASRPA